MTVTLAPATAADIDAVMTVMGSAFDPRFGEAWSAAQVLGSFATATAWARLAHDASGAPVGFTLCRQLGPEAELLLIAVVPHARGNGAGRALIAAGRADAAARGLIEMFLEVRDGNAAALALYRAAGFTVIGRRRNYYRGGDGQTFDAITLRRALHD